MENACHIKLQASPLTFRKAVLMGKELTEEEVQPQSNLSVHSLEDGERFLEDVRWSGDKSQPSLTQAFMKIQFLI